MPTLILIAEDIIKNAQGAVFLNQSKFQIPYIYDLIHQYRQLVMRMTYEKTGRIHPLWTQQFIPEFTKDLQESLKYVRFDVPAPVVLDDQTDGFIYIGTLDRSCAFRKLQNRAELALFNEHRVTKSGNIKTIWSDGFLEVWSNPLQKEVRIDGIFSNPTLLPSYNLEFSEYPLDGDSITTMKQLIYGAQTEPMAKTPAQYKANLIDISANK